MPSPKDFKTEEEFLTQCIPLLVNEGKSQEESIAVCKSMWAQATEIKQEIKTPKGKIEILNDIKKMIDKNGYNIADDKLIELFNVIGKADTLNKKFSLFIHEDGDNYEIQVFPRKRVFIEKYDEYLDFNESMFKEMILNFRNDKLFRPYIDLEHQLGEKYADIMDVYEREDGLFALIHLNDNGKELIKSNKYSYISPEWGERVDTDKILHKNVLYAITLTNVPALEGELPKLQEQIRLDIKGGTMNIKEKLIKLEGKLSNFKMQDEAAELPPVLLEAIQMIKEALAKIDELTQQKDVAEEQAEEIMDRLNKIESEQATEEKELFFNEVVKSGQLEVKDLDDWKDQYDKSKDFVKKILSKRTMKAEGQKTVTAQVKNDELTEEDYFMMDNHGFKFPDGSYDLTRYKKEVLGGKANG